MLQAMFFSYTFLMHISIPRTSEKLTLLSQHFLNLSDHSLPSSSPSLSLFLLLFLAVYLLLSQHFNLWYILWENSRQIRIYFEMKSVAENYSIVRMWSPDSFLSSSCFFGAIFSWNSYKSYLCNCCRNGIWGYHPSQCSLPSLWKSIRKCS